MGESGRLPVSRKSAGVASCCVLVIGDAMGSGPRLVSGPLDGEEDRPQIGVPHQSTDSHSTTERTWPVVKKLSVTVPARAPLPRGPHRARADEGWNELPSHAPDEIIPGLWMGGSPLGGYGDFDVVVDLEHAAPWFEFDGVHVHWPIDDGPMPDPTTALALGEFVAEFVRLGRKVLVHCSAGLNRSGLIVALALVALGYEPREAMARMRRLRSEWVLCNDNFEEFVLDRKAA
jgi:Dual specificity phosphatase, catalytic domain